MSKPPPTGYRQTTLEQCKEADKLLWTKLSEATRGDVKVEAGGARPVEVHFIQLTTTPDILLLLQPLPLPPPSVPDKDNVRSGPYDRDDKGKGKGKGKKGQKGDFSLPNGCVAKNAENKPTCFNFNWNNCKRATPGKRCDRGMHICFKDKCP